MIGEQPDFHNRVVTQEEWRAWLATGPPAKRMPRIVFWVGVIMLAPFVLFVDLAYRVFGKKEVKIKHPKMSGIFGKVRRT